MTGWSSGGRRRAARQGQGADKQPRKSAVGTCALAAGWRSDRATLSGRMERQLRRGFDCFLGCTWLKTPGVPLLCGAGRGPPAGAPGAEPQAGGAAVPGGPSVTA